MDVLRDLGLTDSEIKVYFALLELDSSTVGPIYNKSGVQDSKIYYILDKLRNKGLVSYVIKNRVKHFQAADPKQLVALIAEKREALDVQQKELENTILPQIEARRKLNVDTQEAIVYETLKGVKSAFDYLLSHTKNEYQVFMMDNTLRDTSVIQFFQNYHKKRIAQKIAVRLLAHRNYKKVVEPWRTQTKMHIKYTSKQLPMGIFIFNGHVMTVIWGEKPTAFIIKSKQNYDYYKQFFESVWSESK